MYDSDGIDHRRTYDRSTILVEARIMAEGQWHDCRILNISAGGAKLAMVSRVKQGLEVQIEIGNFGRFNGTVMWQNSSELGLRFSHDPTEMTEVIMGLAIYG